MGAAEQERRWAFIQRVRALLDQHQKTWTVEESPGRVTLIYDPDAAEALATRPPIAAMPTD